MGRYLANCFWLMLPVLALNLALGGSLPAAFDPDIVAERVPEALAVAENVLRLLTIALPVIMPLATRDRRGRLGLVVYGLGLLAYAASWVPLVGFAQSDWSTSVAGLVAPAVTPVIWIAGISLIGDRDYLLARTPRWTFLAAGTVFWVVHVTRTFLVVS